MRLGKQRRVLGESSDLLGFKVPTLLAQGTMQLDITITDSPSRESLDLIASGLDGFNLDAAGYADRRELAVLVTDPQTGKVLGGLTGRTSLGMLFIDLFYLPAELRGQDLGSRILAAAEDEARRRGCCSGLLYTISFQAPDFYVKQGWRVFGEIPCEPAGTRRVFFSKDLLAS